MEREKNSVPTDTLFVTGYNTTYTSDSEIRSLFDYYGPLERLDRRHSNYFVIYRYIEDATAAKNQLNGYMFHGRQLVVEFSVRGVRNKDPKPYAILIILITFFFFLHHYL